MILPSKGSFSNTPGITVIGGIFHFDPNPYSQSNVKANIQVFHQEKDNNPIISIKKNVSWSWKTHLFSLYNEYILTEGKSVDTRLSISTRYRNLHYFFETDMINMNRLTGVSGGLSFAPSTNMRITYLFNKFFEFKQASSAASLHYFTMNNRLSYRFLYYPIIHKLSHKVDFHFNKHITANIIYSHSLLDVNNSNLSCCLTYNV